MLWVRARTESETENQRWMQPSLNEVLCGFNYKQIIPPLNDPSIDCNNKSVATVEIAIPHCTNFSPCVNKIRLMVSRNILALHIIAVSEEIS